MMLPPLDFAYGHGVRSTWTAAHALSGWCDTAAKQATEEAEPIATKAVGVPDFLQLNRGALSAGMVTTSQFRSYRNQHGVNRKLFIPLEGRKHPPERLPAKALPQDTVFGRRTKPHTHISEVLRHKFRNTRTDCEKRREREKAPVKNDFKVVAENRCAQLKVHIVDTGVLAQPWRMPRFLNKAKPHLCTFRSSSALKRAKEADFFESSGRDGETGHGIPKARFATHPYTKHYCLTGPSSICIDGPQSRWKGRTSLVLDCQGL